MGQVGGNKLLFVLSLQLLVWPRLLFVIRGHIFASFQCIVEACFLWSKFLGWASSNIDTFRVGEKKENKNYNTPEEFFVLVLLTGLNKFCRNFFHWKNTTDGWRFQYNAFPYYFFAWSRFKEDMKSWDNFFWSRATSVYVFGVKNSCDLIDTTFVKLNQEDIHFLS